MTQITPDQVKNLWYHGGQIDRGDDYSPVTIDDLHGLDIDTDDDGTPTDDMWQVLADQLNSEQPGEVGGGPGGETYNILQRTLIRLQAAQDTADELKDERDDLIRQALAERVPYKALEDLTGLSRGRLDQIRQRTR